MTKAQQLALYEHKHMTSHWHDVAGAWVKTSEHEDMSVGEKCTICDAWDVRLQALK